MPGSFKGCFGFLPGKRAGTNGSGRLGKPDLGRYAYENKMPERLFRFLEDEERKHLEDAPSRIILILNKLLEQDQDVEVAYLCHSAVRYVGKIKARSKNEGNSFCGYHNIQMLFSYIIAANPQRLESSDRSIPKIFELQDIIEAAWDQGFNESGRLQTGGIKGTRKHIGTPEAQALFRSLNIPCKADRFQDVKGSATSYGQLLDSVEHYFSSPVTTSHPRGSPKVQSMGLPPIYLQRPRHSMTIIGLEKQKDGSRSLIVFDPAYNPSKELLRILKFDSTTKGIDASVSLIEPYRRGKKYLKRYHAFETLRLVAPSESPLVVQMNS